MAKIIPSVIVYDNKICAKEHLCLIPELFKFTVRYGRKSGRLVLNAYLTNIPLNAGFM
jgi:hypothetical protein